MEAILIFVLTTVVAGKEAYHPLSPHVQCPKWPLVITLKVGGLLHLFGPPKGFIRPSPHSPHEEDTQHSLHVCGAIWPIPYLFIHNRLGKGCTYLVVVCWSYWREC
jgi:hypothetical protein